MQPSERLDNFTIHVHPLEDIGDDSDTLGDQEGIVPLLVVVVTETVQCLVDQVVDVPLFLGLEVAGADSRLVVVLPSLLLHVAGELRHHLHLAGLGHLRFEYVLLAGAIVGYVAQVDLWESAELV